MPCRIGALWCFTTARAATARTVPRPQALAANFVSRFAWPVRQPVTSYRRGDMAHYAAVVYVGTNYGEPLPRSFLSDARAGMRPVLWLGGNAYQLTDAAFARDHGWRAGPGRGRHYTPVPEPPRRLTTTHNHLPGIDVVHPPGATGL